MLSQGEVARLLEEPSPQVRAAVATMLAHDIESTRLSDTERAAVQDLIRQMAKDVEVVVRQALSQSLRFANWLPHDLALRLANDVDAVALPMLIDSSVLTDGDLIQIVRQGAVAKQEAIGARAGVSETVADALIATAPETAVAALMRNATAKISEYGLGRAVERFADSDPVKEGMVLRKHLPPALAERLVAIVSDSLREHLLSHHEISPSSAADIVLRSREQATVALTLGASEPDLAGLVAQMHANGRLTPSLLLRVLCTGDLAFFEVAIACLAKVPAANARILIHDAGPNGLASLYQKSRLPPAFLPVVRAAIDVMHEVRLDGGENDLQRFRTRVIIRVLTQFEEFSQADLDYLLGKLGGPMLQAA
jgi:uncharacterized protein (DUF2336 family)